MSAFKPPQKITSPVSAPALVWSPPSANLTFSPTGDGVPFPVSLSPAAHGPAAPWAPAPQRDPPRRVLGPAANRFENDPLPRAAPLSPHRDRPQGYDPPTPPTHAPSPAQNYPVRAIPSQNDLAAPGLVHKLDGAPRDYADSYVPKVDAQRLQIEFYEKQIRDKKIREPISNGHHEPAPRPPPYTVTDYTPAGGVSTFVPLQQTPDIEKARAHRVARLPDVVLRHETRPGGPPPARDDEPTEHGSVVTRVMRGPVSQSATITAGARTRHDPRPRAAPAARAADDLRGALDRASAPRRDGRSQVRPAPPAPPACPPAPPQAPSPRPPAIKYEPLSPRSPAHSSESAASRDSSPGAALSRSGSWQQLAERRSPASPRRVVARAKSMHLLVVPKLFEGGISRDALPDKRRTVEAYFAGAQTTTAAAAAPARASRRRAGGFALGRSRTMPSVAELQLLDESNADDAFEHLVSALA